MTTPTEPRTFLIQAGTTHNGWMPSYSEVTVPASAICRHCNGYGHYDEGQLECDACEMRGHTLGDMGIRALAIQQWWGK